MSDEVKEETTSTLTDFKTGSNPVIVKESSEVAKYDESKKEDGKEISKQESKEISKQESESEEEMGLLDRPVEVTGCRERKKVERFECTIVATSKEKHEIPEGKGQKLADCPRIEQQIQKNTAASLKPLHRILFGRTGSVNEVKKNVKKFSGFCFEKDSQDYERKKSTIEKFTTPILKHICEVLDVEKGGTKDDIATRLLNFLLNPKDSGKNVTKKKSLNKERKKSSEKKCKNEKKTPKAGTSENAGSSNNDNDASDLDDSDDEAELSNEEEVEPDHKSEKTSKERSKNESKQSLKAPKRKRDNSSDLKDEPPTKKVEEPSDDEIRNLVKKILENANLHEITMKKVIKQVGDTYPGLDLSRKKTFIKTTIKSVIS